MKKLIFLQLVLIRSELIKLDKTNIKDFINEPSSSSYPAKGIMFHVSWCGACKATLPEYEAAAISLNEAAILGEYDCTDDGEFCATEFGVHFYPQLRFRGKNLPWFALPRYDRTKDKMMEFIGKVSESVPVVPSDSANVRNLLEKRLVSVVLAGDWSVEDLTPVLTPLKARYQFVAVRNKDLLPLDMRFAEPRYVLLVVNKSVLVTGSWGYYPKFVGVIEDIESWLARTPFPGLWKIEESMFQLFNDQNVYKVLISQDPSIASSNRTIQSAVADCMDSSDDRLRSEFSFAIINGPGFAAALSEFEVGQNLGILVLGKEPMDYSLFYSEEFESVSDDLCEGLVRILNGEMTPQYRGSFFSRWNYRYTKFLKRHGIDTELWRVGILITLLFFFIFGLVAIAGRALRDTDIATTTIVDYHHVRATAAAAASTSSDKKKD